MAYANTTTIMDYRIAPGISKDVLQVAGKLDTVDIIKSVVSRVHVIGFDELRVKTRSQAIVRARNQMAYLVYLYTVLSLEDIMLLFYPALTGHCSVLYAVHTIERLIESEKIIRNQFMLYGLQQCLNELTYLPQMKIKFYGVWRLKSEII